MANPLFMYCMLNWAWHGKRFSFMVSFEMFLNSNCSTDLTNFWKRFDHFSCHFLLLRCFCYAMLIGFIWCESTGYGCMCLICTHLFMWTDLGVIWDEIWTIRIYLTWCLELFPMFCGWDGTGAIGFCVLHLHGYIGFYGVNKFGDCSPFVEFSCDLQGYRRVWKSNTQLTDVHELIIYICTSRLPFWL